MIMDPSFTGPPGFTNGFPIEEKSLVHNIEQFQNLGTNGCEFSNLPGSSNSNPFHSPDIDFRSVPPFVGETFGSSNWSMIPENARSYVPSGVGTSGANTCFEDTDFSETGKYISQILMEENIEDKPCMFHDPLSLKLTEKSFYDVIGKNYPPSPTQHPLDSHQTVESPECNSSGWSVDSVNSTSSSSSRDITCLVNLGDFGLTLPDMSFPSDHAFQLKSESFMPNHLPNNQTTSVSNGLLDSSLSEILVPNIFNNRESVLQFNRGLEEASKFLPKSAQLTSGLENSMLSLESNKETERHVLNTNIGLRENSPTGLKGSKSHGREDSDPEEERCRKQSAVYVDDSELSEMFDRVLLCTENFPLCSANQTTQCEPGKPQQSNGGKSRSRKGKKKESVDLRTLLILCAQAVSANDNRTANELLKQIRQHSSPYGDGSQRVAHFFANGLEARLVGDGTGTQIFYNSSISQRMSAANILKAYQVHLSACPFKKFSIFFANKMIMKAAVNAKTLHIVDFGILYGFQWPILIKFLSERAGGPPKLRITGIELPQAGFRPAERVEETGRRLAKYCERFNVPFKYNAVASQKWETIQIEDLKIQSNDEVLAVNCLCRFTNLLDETVETNSPKDGVMNLIKKMKPDLFVHSIINGSYNAPFFVTRFREALFHFSALYDMFDVTVSRECEYRMMFEKEIYGREAINVIACEGAERVERPEIYKQWQARSIKAGFRQLPLDKELMDKFRAKLNVWYHKDFVIDEDSNWMLQGWKGRIVYASSCWVTA